MLDLHIAGQCDRYDKRPSHRKKQPGGRASHFLNTPIPREHANFPEHRQNAALQTLARSLDATPSAEVVGCAALCRFISLITPTSVGWQMVGNSQPIQSIQKLRSPASTGKFTIVDQFSLQFSFSLERVTCGARLFLQIVL